MSGENDQDRLSEWKAYWDDGSMSKMHAHKPHEKIVQYLDQMTNGKDQAKMFFPLCGDVVDMVRCVEKGHTVVGVECSELGVKSFFDQHNIEAVVTDCKHTEGKLYKSKDDKYRIYCCDLFNFDISVEGQFDAIIDFGSMGAIYKRDLEAYAKLMTSLLKPDGRHLLECFVYDLDKFPDSLPHCFTVDRLQMLYGPHFEVTKLEEGPNPYLECEANLTEGEEPCKDEGEFPDITGAAYFMLRHRSI